MIRKIVCCVVLGLFASPEAWSGFATRDTLGFDVHKWSRYSGTRWQYFYPPQPPISPPLPPPPSFSLIPQLNIPSTGVVSSDAAEMKWRRCSFPFSGTDFRIGNRKEKETNSEGGRRANPVSLTAHLPAFPFPTSPLFNSCFIISVWAG